MLGQTVKLFRWNHEKKYFLVFRNEYLENKTTVRDEEKVLEKKKRKLMLDLVLFKLKSPSLVAGRCLMFLTLKTAASPVECDWTGFAYIGSANCIQRSTNRKEMREREKRNQATNKQRRHAVELAETLLDYAGTWKRLRWPLDVSGWACPIFQSDRNRAVFRTQLLSKGLFEWTIHR